MPYFVQGGVVIIMLNLLQTAEVLRKARTWEDLNELDLNKLAKDLEELNKYKNLDAGQSLERMMKTLPTPDSPTIFPMAYKAYYKAMVEHKNDIRKGTQLPYLPHVIGVWRILMKLSYSHGKDYLYAAALLHDYVEDHVNREDRSVTLSWMVTQFGSLCVGIINELTSDEPIRQDNNGDKYYQIEENGVHREVNKIDYVNGKLMKMSSDALIIKLADIVDNLSDSDTMPKFPYRIRAHLRFIKDNMDAFAPRLSPDHRRLLDSIDRMLDTFYPTF